jgi:DNA-binding protein YbaB
MDDTARQLAARIEAIDTAAAENDRRAEAYQHVAEELKDARGEATSPDGAVTVVAGAGGAITSVVFHDKSAPSETLAAAVVGAIAQAQADAARAQAEVVRRELGSSELLDRVLDSDEEIFGAPRPSTLAPAAPPQTGRPRQAAEDDVEELTVFGSGASRYAFDGDEPSRHS